jgi:hypothetical protein
MFSRSANHLSCPRETKDFWFVRKCFESRPKNPDAVGQQPNLGVAMVQDCRLNLIPASLTS